MKNKALQKRFDNTLNFLTSTVPPPCKVLDLGTPNLLSERMREEGYKVTNTKGEDLDIDYGFIKEFSGDLVTAFEIFEHLLAPFNVLRALPTNKLVASVPLRLWFNKAYWNENEEWDRHYHEFEVRQFNWLLDKTGWKVIQSEKWVSSSGKIGLRPLLRNYTYRYYIVYCERFTQND